ACDSPRDLVAKFPTRLVALLVGLSLVVPVSRSSAQTYSIVHQFGSDPDDGVQPLASLTLVGSTLYGTTAGDEYGGGGGVFRLNTDGSGYTNLQSVGWSRAALICVGSTLYGTTE